MSARSASSAAWPRVPKTVAVYVVLFLLPQYAMVIVWSFTAAVAITAVQRVVFGVRLLRAPTATWPTATGPADVPAARAGGPHRRGGAAPAS
jgi:hypothetical protein